MTHTTNGHRPSAEQRAQVLVAEVNRCFGGRPTSSVQRTSPRRRRRLCAQPYARDARSRSWPMTSALSLGTSSKRLPGPAAHDRSPTWSGRFRRRTSLKEQRSIARATGSDNTNLTRWRPAYSSSCSHRAASAT